MIRNNEHFLTFIFGSKPRISSKHDVILFGFDIFLIPWLGIKIAVIHQESTLSLSSFLSVNIWPIDLPQSDVKRPAIPCQNKNDGHCTGCPNFKLVKAPLIDKTAIMEKNQLWKIYIDIYIIVYNINNDRSNT